jgi:hypothetical protein
MKHFRYLVVLAQAALLAGWANAGSVTVNGTNCGNASGNVIVSANGDITVNTDNQDACVPGTTTPGGPYAVNVTVGGTGTRGTVSGTGIDCGSDCTESIASGGSIELTATAPTGSDTFAWGGACASSGSALTCNLSNITSAKSVTATYNAPGSTTACPTGVTCVDATWPVIAQQTFSMKANGIMAFKVNTTGAGVTGTVNTMYTTGNTATRLVSLSTTPGDFAPSSARCLKEGLEVTTTAWQQSGTDTRKCQIPANSEAWINIKFTNCTATSCSFYLKAN